MSHLVEQITKYMNSTGHIIWYQNSEKLKKQVFLRPSLIFDMLFVLFRRNFHENFRDAHVQTLRLKLLTINNSASVDSTTSDERIRSMSKDLLQTGRVHFDLLKLLWFPILIISSPSLLKQITLILMDLFHLAYPVMAKDRVKMLTHQMELARTKRNHQHQHNHHHEQQQSSVETMEQMLSQINEIVVPFYLPVLEDESQILKSKFKLRNEWSQAVGMAVGYKLKKAKPTLVSKIAQKYTFQWGLLPGVFEKFSVNCFFNSDLYFISHYRNFIYAYNEENTVG